MRGMPIRVLDSMRDALCGRSRDTVLLALALLALTWACLAVWRATELGWLRLAGAAAGGLLLAWSGLGLLLTLNLHTGPPPPGRHTRRRRHPSAGRHRGRRGWNLVRAAVGGCRRNSARRTGCDTATARVGAATAQPAHAGRLDGARRRRHTAAGGTATWHDSTAASVAAARAGDGGAAPPAPAPASRSHPSTV